MKKSIRIYVALLALIGSHQAQSQDIHFSQIFETPLLRNPALAGLFQGDIRIQSVYRTQWNSVTVPYRTGSLDGEVKLPVGKGNDYLTLGVQFLYDKAGTVELTATHILPALNYHKSLSDEKNSYLSLGFMGGWVQRSIDRSKMTTNSQFDGSHYNENLSDGEYFTSPNYSYFDASVGMSYNSQIGLNSDNNMFVGLAYHHFNKPKKLSFYTDNDVEGAPKIVGSAGVRMSMLNHSYFTIQADYSKQGAYTETVLGALYSWRFGNDENPQYAFHTGAYMRWKDALIPVMKLEARAIAIALSYDVNISPLRTASTGRGGFECSLSYQKFFDRHNSSKEAIRCPRF